MSYSFEEATFGFETAKQILGVGSNTMSKLIDLNLVSVLNTPSSVRNQQYSGWDLGYLASARNRPLLVPDGQMALVCSMGLEDHLGVPSMYFDATWEKRRKDLDEIQRNVDSSVWERIVNSELRVTGHWAVKEADADFLAANNSIVVASYAGFILDGGRVHSWVPNVFDENGRRCFIVEPFSQKERFEYAHNYLESRQGPPNKVWTAEALQAEALAK